jgi:hypothetical protein
MGAHLEPVLSGDGDPFVIRKEGICGPEVVWCGESKVCGLTDGREDVEVGKGGKDEDEDDCFYGGKRSARCEGSRDGTHCFRDLVRTIRMRVLRSAESWVTDQNRRPLVWTASGQMSVRTTWTTMKPTWLL